MIQMILMLSLSAVSAPSGARTAQFMPCQMPNRCAAEALVLAQFMPCRMPNRCVAQPQIADL